MQRNVESLCSYTVKYVGLREGREGRQGKQHDHSQQTTLLV